MRNLDIRVMVSDSGLRYIDIAKQMGISRVWLSNLMRYELTIENREKILRAIKELKQKKERRIKNERNISTNHIDYLFDNYNNQLDQQKVREIMNKVSLIGRLTKDPETRYSTGENPTAISRYTLAVDRRKKGEADFIRCVTFGNQAEFASKYLHKGVKVGVCGRIQTGSYKAQDGSTRYTTDVVVEEHDFMESKTRQEDKFEAVDVSNQELPFV